MAGFLNRSTKSTDELVLAVDPAVAAVCTPDQLKIVRETGRMPEGIATPVDAIRVYVRALSLSERDRVDDAADAARANVSRIMQGDADDADINLALARISRHSARERVKIGVVKAVEGSAEIKGGEALLLALDALPLLDREAALYDISNAIQKLSTLDLGKG